jgi:tetratricopeptide (TPR) repeat protein
VASETDEFRIFYGQVLYWLGRYKDGRKLFDEYLASKNDAFASLIGVARMLREVGADAECRELCEKAYNKTSLTEEKSAAAHMRAVAFTDLEDKIKWLGLSSPTENEVKADLCYARGTKAHLEGNNAEAEKQLRECIAVYASMPRTSATLNNAALAYYSLFPITGLKEDYKQGASMMEEALKLEPGKSILLDNVSQALAGRTVMDLAGDEVDYKILRILPGLDILDDLYSDENGRAATYTRFFGHPDGKKAVSLLEQTLLLAPKRASIYHELSHFYLCSRNAGALKGLLEKAKGVEFDAKENIQTLVEYCAGLRDPEIQSEVKVRLAKWEKTLADMPKDAKGLTAALACEKYIQAAYEGYPANVPCDPEKIVGLAERALAAKDCSGTRSTLRTALFFRAHQRLCKTVPEFAAIDKRLRRNMSFTDILAVGLDKLPALRESAAEDPDMKKAMGLLYDSVRAIPMSTSSWDWMMLTHLNPEGAREALENLKRDEANLTACELSFTMNPHSSDAAHTLSWLLRALGQNERAQTVLKDCAKFGFPMP